MERQKMNVATLVLVTAIVLIVGVIAGVFIGKNMNQVQTSKKGEEEKIQQENKIVETDLLNQEEKFIVPSLFTSNAKRVRNEKGEKYMLEISDISNILQINIEDGVPEICITKTAKEIEGYGLDISKIKINNTMQKIKGFSKKVVDCCTILDTRQVAATTIIFLMEDGTVEYSTLQNMIDNISSQGKIEGLSNIIRLQKVLLSSQNLDTSAIVIDKNNDYYDVSEYIGKENNLSSKEEVNRNLEDLAWILRDIECELGKLLNNVNILTSLENKYYLAWSAMNHDKNEKSKFQGINARGEEETGARAIKVDEFAKYYKNIYQEELDLTALLKTKVGSKVTVKNGIMYSNIVTGYNQDVFHIETEDIKLDEKSNMYTLKANCSRKSTNENKKIEIQYQKDTNGQIKMLKSISVIK